MQLNSNWKRRINQHPGAFPSSTYDSATCSYEYQEWDVASLSFYCSAAALWHVWTPDKKDNKLNQRDPLLNLRGENRECQKLRTMKMFLMFTTSLKWSERKCMPLSIAPSTDSTFTWWDTRCQMSDLPSYSYQPSVMYSTDAAYSSASCSFRVIQCWSGLFAPST